jgi:hypothetical protein
LNPLHQTIAALHRAAHCPRVVVERSSPTGDGTSTKRRSVLTKRRNLCTKRPTLCSKRRTRCGKRQTLCTIRRTTRTNRRTARTSDRGLARIDPVPVLWSSSAPHQPSQASRVAGEGRAPVGEGSAPGDRRAVGNDWASIALVRRPAPSGERPHTPIRSGRSPVARASTNARRRSTTRLRCVEFYSPTRLCPLPAHTRHRQDADSQRRHRAGNASAGVAEVTFPQRRVKSPVPFSLSTLPHLRIATWFFSIRSA